MMEYKNMKTGATFSSPCVISGGDWILAEEESLTTIEPQTGSQYEDIKQVETEKNISASTAENSEEFDGITRVQIMQELDAFGIEYDKKANKKVLYDLMMQGK
ncbi:hypothetical protein AB6881_00915 [Carnobacterium maltaromaticum]|uniref:hypothetical protein n=2 Tax=Carnobacterium maltaromaticum TaxID=2751 RepID=UPI0039AFE675